MLDASVTITTMKRKYPDLWEESATHVLLIPDLVKEGRVSVEDGEAWIAAQADLINRHIIRHRDAP